MLYLAEFTCDGRWGELEEDGLAFGSFSALAEAETIDDVLKLLRRLVRRHMTDKRILAGATSIYLDNLVEVKRMPKGGVVTYCVLTHGEQRPNLNMSLPGYRGTDCNAYAYCDDDKDADIGAEGAYTVDPFITAKAKTKAASKQ